MKTRLIGVLIGALVVFLALAGQDSALSWPDSPAGRIAARYFKAFNSGSDAEMTDFIKESISPASLGQRSLETRLAVTHDMRAQMGSLAPQRILAFGNDRLVVLVKTEKGALTEFSSSSTPQLPAS